MSATCGTPVCAPVMFVLHVGFEKKSPEAALVDCEFFECEELARFAYETWRENPHPKCDWIALVKRDACENKQTLVDKHSFNWRSAPEQNKQHPLQVPRDRVIDEAKKLRDMRGHGTLTPLFDAIDGLRVVETQMGVR